MTATSNLFSNLTIEDAELPRTRVSLSDNPVYAAFKASSEQRTDKGAGTWEGKGKSIKIPAAACPELERYVRQAAEALKVGSAVRLRTPDGKIVDVVSVGAKTVKGKNGKDRKSGGTPTPMVGGKAYTGDVMAYFNAKSPRKMKDKKPASPATPATPAAATPGK